MGLFDNKNVGEEKRIYKLLCLIKDVSNNLKMFLPKTEREFIDSPNKARLIFTYKIANEMMKDNEIVQYFKLSNLGVCYDFVAKYTNSPTCDMSSLDEFMIDLKQKLIVEIEKNVILMEENMVNSVRKTLSLEEEKLFAKEKKISDFSDEIMGRLRQLDSSPSNQKIIDVVSKEASSLSLEMKKREFDEIFPEYNKLKADILRLEMGISDNKQFSKLVERLKAANSQFEINDLLILYLIEKQYMGILDDKSELEILNNFFKRYSEPKILWKEILNIKMYFTLDVIYYIFENFERVGRFTISQQAYYEKFWEPFEGNNKFFDNLENDLNKEEKQFGPKR